MPLFYAKLAKNSPFSANKQVTENQHFLQR